MREPADLVYAQSLGAEFLDTHRPGWRSDIDVDILDLEHYLYCVGGQLFGSYYEFLNWVEQDGHRVTNGEIWAVQNGFSPAYHEANELTELWIAEVKAGSNHE